MLSLPLPPTPTPAKLRFALLAATWLTGDEVGGAGEEILLRGFVGRRRGEKLESLEIVRLHLGVMRSGATATGEKEDGKKQGQLGDNGSQVADDGVWSGVINELLTAVHEDDRQEDRKGEEHPAHEAVALGGAAKDFGSRGRRGTGHSRGKSERPASAGNPALGRVVVTNGGLSKGNMDG